MKKGFKKLICMGLTLTMLLGLAACGKDNETNGGGIASGGKNDKNNPNAALAKEYVFSEQTLDMPELGDDMNIRMMTEVNDKIYVLCEIYDYDSMENQNQLKLLSMNGDGTDIQVKDIQLYMGGVSPNVPVVDEAGSAGDAQETTESTSDAAQTEDAAQDAPVADNGIMEDMAIMENYVYEYTGIGHMAVSADGKIYGIKNYYYENYGGETPVSVNENYVCCWDMEGIMLWESKMEPLQTEESWGYVQEILALKDGKIGVLIGGDKSELMLVAADGTLGEKKPMAEVAEALANVADVFSRPDGTISYIYYDTEDYAKMYLNTYDFNTNTAGEPTQLPDSMIMSGYMALADGGEIADLLYSTNMGIFAVNMGDTEPRQLMSFINSDIATNNMNNFVVLDEEHILGFYHDNIEGTTKGGLFAKVAPEDIEDKAVLVLAANWLDWNLKNRVVEYNKNNSQYRIVVKDYSSYNTMDDYMAGYTKLNNDILASGMPDILVADTQMPIESYIKKGLVADVEALIAADEELSQKEFMQNVFDAYRVDGKLYYVIPSFAVRTYIGKTAIVGDRTSWTMQDMQALAKNQPEGTMMMGEMLRDSFMYTMMQFCGTNFIDLSTGKCDFNSPNFISMLEYAKTLPGEWSEDLFGEDYYMNYESQYRENRTILMSCYVSDARDMNRNINGYFGEDISYIGFPNDSGDGSVLLANSQYVLSAKSPNLEGAWDFVRYYLTDEYQKELSYELPVVKSVLVEKANEAKEKPYYMDEETGEKVEYDDYFYLNGESFPLPNMTQEQVDEFIGLVSGVTRRAYYNEEVQNIINEEAAAFFEGQKSAADVAGIIQSRVQIYVNENM